MFSRGKLYVKVNVFLLKNFSKFAKPYKNTKYICMVGN